MTKEEYIADLKSINATGMECIDYAIKSLEQQPCDDCVSRVELMKLYYEARPTLATNVYEFGEKLQALPPVTPTQRWISVSEGLPKELEPVNITWINHNPESYYADIKGKPFTSTGVYFNGQWYWWSTLCTDILAEYSHNYDDIIDNAIEVTAWQPLPQPYEEKRGNENEVN